MPDYTAWPTADDVATRLDEVGYGLTTAGLARVDTVLGAVVAQVTRQTMRRFVADTVDETKVYDGSGTPEMEIDEIISLTKVTIVGGFGVPGYDLANVRTVVEQGKPVTRLITIRGTLSAYVTAGSDGTPVSASSQSLFWVFPSGRQNIEITGKFGYGPTVPLDLWDAVCGEAALRLLRPQFVGGGRVASGEAAGLQLVEEQYGDEKRRYAKFDHADLGWREEFDTALARYKRPQGRRLRKLRGDML